MQASEIAFNVVIFYSEYLEFSECKIFSMSITLLLRLYSNDITMHFYELKYSLEGNLSSLFSFAC